ncbi:hypothetical protein [Stappia stellulata]|uniref:hypothetical protein n=1 Tax=Stappia stellulata TaxID=71235 RepID=UPI0012EB683A|nr:hypothetical protein [Stappia stellulata]
MLSTEEFDCLDAYLAAFNVCLENRNLIAHSQINMNDVDGGISLTKSSKKDHLSLNRYHVPTDDMMEVARTMDDLKNNGFALSLAIWAGPKRLLSLGGQKLLPVPLPSRFPLPRKLNPLPRKD